MTSQDWVAIIAALSIAIVNVITAWRTSAKVQAVKESAEHNAGRVADKLDVIHDLTNSNLAAVKADLILAKEEIAGLKGLLAKVAGTVEKAS